MPPPWINMAPLQNVPVLRNIILDAGVVSKREDWHTGEGPLPDEAIERMKSELNLGYLEPLRTVYGPPLVMEQYLDMIKGAFSQIPGSRFLVDVSGRRCQKHRKTNATVGGLN